MSLSHVGAVDRARRGEPAAATTACPAPETLRERLSQILNTMRMTESGLVTIGQNLGSQMDPRPLEGGEVPPEPQNLDAMICQLNQVALDANRRVEVIAKHI